MFVDVETTGLDPFAHEILEIAACRVRPGAADDLSKTSWFESKVRPSAIHRASPEALRVNGYDQVQWASAPPAEEVVRAFADFCAGAPAIMLAWNPTFDVPFIKAAFRQAGVDFPASVDYHVLDVASMAWPLVAARESAGLKLAHVCDRLGVSNEGQHRARVDVERMMQVFSAATAVHEHPAVLARWPQRP